MQVKYFASCIYDLLCRIVILSLHTVSKCPSCNDLHYVDVRSISSERLYSVTFCFRDWRTCGHYIACSQTLLADPSV